MDQYRVGIIGCGSIGALKPIEFDGPETHNILTHAHAVYSNEKAQLVAVVDTDKEKGNEAANRWGGTPYSSLWEMMTREEGLDIIIVATPTETHLEILSEIALHEKMPKLIIAEKPLTQSSIQCKEIKSRYDDIGIPLLVNYTRRWNPSIQVLKKQFDDGIFGNAMSCSITYTHSLLRDGCHGIDFLNWFFGECQQATTLTLSVKDGYDERPIFLEYEKCPHCFLIPVNWHKYSIFEVDVLCDYGRFILIDGGRQIRIYRKRKEGVYGNYDYLSGFPDRIILTDLTNTLGCMLNNAVGFLQSQQFFCTCNPEILLCNAKDALNVHKVIDIIHNNERKGVSKHVQISN